MFINANQIDLDGYDLCVIGAGPAGIILCLEYARLRPEHRILLLECGKKGTTVNPLDETVRVTNLKNHYAPYDCTNKGLGGSSISWGGRCVMYDEIDFLPHGPVQEHCTWSLDFLKELDPYLDRTSQYFLCGSAVFDASEVESVRDSVIAKGFQSGRVTDSRLERWSLPTRFGREYQRELEQSRSIFVLTGYYATQFVDVDSDGRVRRVDAISLDGASSIKVTASRFVISAGGHESTRLLLKSPKVFSRLERIPPTLGKYYQGHISGKIARVRFYGDPDKTEFGFIKDEGGVFCRRRFQFTSDFLVDSGILNTAFWLDNPPYYDALHGNGVMSAIYLLLICPILKKKLLPPAIWRSVTGGSTRQVKRHLLNVLKDFPMSLLTPLSIFMGRYLRKRSLPGVFLRSDDNRYSLHFHAEQTPREENRMELAKGGEELVLHFEYCDEDVNSVIRAHRALDTYLREIGCGELEYVCDDNHMAQRVKDGSIDGTHQVGTTRIGSSPNEGVVDSDLRVWGTKNVYVCSSSVFPTSGQANPTFMLGACAVRVAKHLTKTLD